MTATTTTITTTAAVMVVLMVLLAGPVGVTTATTTTTTIATPVMVLSAKPVKMTTANAAVMVVLMVLLAGPVGVMTTTTITTTTASISSTFLAVTQDMAPPPSPNTTTTTTMDINLAECSKLCHASTVENCLAFVWRPVPSTQSQVMSDNNNNNNSSSSSSSLSMSSEGKCELLSCLPHPAYLIPFLGAHLFVVKLPDSTVPPPHFTHTLVPPRYSMGCTFAFRVFGSEQLQYIQAERRCAQDGARLVVFKSGEEEKTVSRDIISTEGYWIGHTDRQRRWADRSDRIYANWGEGQPNNHVHENTDQACVMLLKGRWSDHQCQEDLRFICQVTLLHP